MASNIFVIMDDPVVAMDLGQSIQTCIPEAAIAVFDTMQAALSAAAAAPAQLALAMLPGDQTLADTIALLKHRLAERLVLFSDDEALIGDAEPGRVIVLPRLFTDDMIASALVTLGVAAR